MQSISGLYFELALALVTIITNCQTGAKSHVASHFFRA